MTASPDPHTDTSHEYRFFRTVVAALANEKLALPALPDVALRVARIASDDNVTVDRLAVEIARDPGITAGLMRVANSAAMRGSTGSTTLQQAITRLGFNKTRVLVSALAAEQLYASPTPDLTQRLRRSWANSVEVAALARTIAHRHTRLDPDEAMLAGMMHEVGILPIIAVAAGDSRIRANPAALDELIFRLHARIGRVLLDSWHFPPSLVAVPEACTDFEREHAGRPDYADVVCVALLHERPLREPWLARVDRTRVRAYERLDLNPHTGVPLVDDFSCEFEQNRLLLTG